MKNQYLLILLFSLLNLRLEAQDIHFSQFFNAPLTVSPSNTGNFDGDWRLTGNYRTQWKSISGAPYLTQAIAFEKQFFLYTENLSGGLMIINDKSAESLRVTKIQLSGGYHKKISKHNLHGGISMGYVMKSFDPNSETYPNQFNWNTGSFDNTLPNQEAGLRDRLSYFDINIGAGYDIQLKKIRPFVTVAMYHLNTPEESFSASGNKLSARKVMSTGLNWKLSEKISVDPMVFLMGTDKASDLLAGGNVNYLLEKTAFTNTSIYSGLFFRDGFKRNWDAFFLTAGIHFKQYSVGLSYDYNISPLQTATNHKGAFEISFIYTALNSRLKKTQLPCDRY